MRWYPEVVVQLVKEKEGDGGGGCCMRKDFYFWDGIRKNIYFVLYRALFNKFIKIISSFNDKSGRVM